MFFKKTSIDERIDVLEGIGINKSNKSTECIICHY